jgi:hypothetical protein
MQELTKKSGTVTSLELVTEINLFRMQDGNKTEILHKNLLAIIRDEFEEEIGMLKIKPTPYSHPQNGQTYEMFILTISQATQILVRESKFVRKAVIAKLEATNAILEIKPKTQAELFLESAQMLVQQEQRINDCEAKQSEQDNRLLQIEAKNATRPDYFTIVGYATLQKKKVGLSLAAAIGKKSSGICEQKGYHIEKVTDPRFGHVNSYPSEVLKIVFSSFSLS